MADTLKRLAGPALLTNSDATQYTVPGSTTTVVRSIEVANTTGSAATLYVSVGADAAGTRIISNKSVAANDIFQWRGSLVLATTETLKAHSDTNSALAFTANGVEVT